MLNILSVLLRFAEPFMDANYTKVSGSLCTAIAPLSPLLQMDRIDPLYFVNCSLISIEDETRIKAISEEATPWEDEHRDPTGSVCLISLWATAYMETSLAQFYLKHIFPYYRHESFWIHQNHFDIQ